MRRLRASTGAQRATRGEHRARRRGAAWLALAAMAGLVTVWVAPAEAVHDTGAFELEGDAENDAAVSGDDWDNVCHEVTVTNDTTNTIPDQCTGVGDTSGATAVEWADDGDLNATIFTGGGSKDPQDITEWLWKDGAGGLPDKDNLLHAFAARYSLPEDDPNCPAGDFPTCELLYFGSDRFDNSGDAQQGFWFLQDEVTLGGGPGGGGTHFTGEHVPGDLLVISQFSNGGTTSTINVWEWDPTCTSTSATCANPNLRILAQSDAANCATVPDGDDFCGIVNPADDTTAPWSFLDKSGNDSYLQGEFFEAGVNLSTLGLANRCFSTVVSESRASTSATATLKDFVIGTFGSCDTTVTTTPKTGGGADIPEGGLSIGTGTVTAKDSATIDVNGIAVWDGSLQFYICGPIADPATCDSGGVAIGSGIAVDEATSQPILSDPATLTSAGRYCWRAEFTSATEGVPNASDSAATECFVVNPVTPNLSTQAVDANGDPITAPVPFGQPLYDKATLAGTATAPGTNGPNATYPSINATNGAAADGTITFTLVGPGDCTTVATGSAGVNPETVDVSGDNDYMTSGFTTDAAGDFHWKAVYSGDSPNTLGASHNDDCSDTNEDVTVLQLNPAVATAQNFVPNDSATVTVASGGGDLAGTVVFQLFVGDNPTCTGTPTYESDPIDISTGSGDGLSRTVVSDNTTAYSADQTFRWVVLFDSDNQAHTDASSACGTEISSITINNSAS